MMAKPDLLQLLREQHAEIDDLVSWLTATTTPRADQFLDFAAKLAAHIAVETRVFYPALMPESSQLRRQSLDECQALKRQVADMLAIDPDGPDGDVFDLKLYHLAVAIRHHAHDFEEAQLFPVLADLMDDDERYTLGVQAAEMYDALLCRDDLSERVAA